MIKARPCAGDIAAGEALLRELAPFVWRKYLDFAAVADIHSMKRQIHAYRGHGEIAVEGHNIKLGRGGIREIEFFVQTQQLIAGGRHPELRERDDARDARRRWRTAAGSTPAGARRPESGLLLPARVEHRLQMVEDEQTHVAAGRRAKGSSALRGFSALPIAMRLPRFCSAICDKVQRHYARPVRETRRRARRPAPALFPPKPTTARRSTAWPRSGFAHPLEVSAIVRSGWRAIIARSRATCARSQLAELVPVLLEHSRRTDNPDAAAGGVRPLPRQSAWRGAAVLAVAAESRSDRADRAGTRYRAAARRYRWRSYPQVMDALIDPSFFGALTGGGRTR